MFRDPHALLGLFVEISARSLVVAAIAALGMAVLRLRNGHVRHRVWTSVLVTMLLMPVLVAVVPTLSVPVPNALSPGKAIDERVINTASFDLTIGEAGNGDPPSSIEPAELALPSSELSQHVGATLDTTAIRPTGRQGEIDRASRSTPAAPSVFAAVCNGLVLLYVAVAVLLTLRLVIGALRASSLIRGSVPLEAQMGFMPGAASGLLRESASIRVPLTVGFFRPRVLLPAKWRSWSAAKRESVIRHELAHVSRRDCLVNLLAEFNRCCYWFHPLAWCLTRWLSELAEHCCDDAVIASTRDRTSYARHLLEIARSVVVMNGRTRVSGVEMARSGNVEARIRAILDMERPLSRKPGRVSRLCLVACMLTTCWLAAGLQAKTHAPAEADTQTAAGATREQANKPPNASNTAGDENLQDGARMTGRVVDADGRPIGAASLSIVLWSYQPDRDRRLAPPVEVWAHGTSDAAGRYELVYRQPVDAEFYNNRAFRLTAIARCDGYGIGWKFLNFEDAVTAAEIVLPDEQIRQGRVVDLEGQPVAGATVHVVTVGQPAPKQVTFHRHAFQHAMPLDETTDTKIPIAADGKKRWEHHIHFRHPPFTITTWPMSTTTSADGSFEIRNAGRDQAVAIHIYGTEKGGSRVAHFGSDGDATRPRTFVLGPARLIEGRVVGAQNGQPIAGARVRVDHSGAAVFYGVMPILADWKGRQGHVGHSYALQGNSPTFAAAPVFAKADDEGRYRVSPIRANDGSPKFRVTVSSPDDRSFLSVSNTISWRDETTFQQQADFALPPGVRIHGRVVSSESGQPIPRARVDFWSRTLAFPAAADPGLMTLSPDGIQHPAWRKTGFDGRFEIIVPHGESYLLVNETTDDNEIDHIDLAELGVEQQEPKGVLANLLAPAPRTEQPARFHPDRLVELNYAADRGQDKLKVELRKAPVLKMLVVKPDGRPALGVQMFAGQQPFLQETTGGLSAIRKTGDGQFEIAHRDLTSPTFAAFVLDEDALGVAVAFTADQIAPEPITVILQPLGTANVRLVDREQQPLSGYRPLVWMSLPVQPFSSPEDLERLATPVIAQRMGGRNSTWLLERPFDSIWTQKLHEQHAELSTDDEGRVALKTLIPHATYRITQFGGETTEFRVGAGETLDLGTVVIHEPQRTAHLPHRGGP